MLFYVAIVILAVSAVSIWRFFFEYADSVIAPFLMWVVSVALVALGLLLVWVGLGTLFSGELKSDTTYRNELRALQSGSGIEGRSYFLGGGYVNNKRVLNHIIRNEDGSSSLGHTDADDSRIYEDSAENPYMLIHEKKYGNWWFGFDDTFRTERTYQYHIPAGSVLESTKITNE